MEPAVGKTMSGLVNVGEGSEGSEGSGFSTVVCGECDRTKGPSHDTILVPAEMANGESYRAAIFGPSELVSCDSCDCDSDRDWYGVGWGVGGSLCEVFRA
jgi:hypothetical protein